MKQVALGKMPQLIDEEFKFHPGYIFLNHAAISPWPQRTANIVSEFAKQNVVTGPLYYPEWLIVEQKLREQLKDLINAPSPDDIALLKNTSEGLSLVAYGLNWNVGDNIVSTAQEFPSNRIVWESLADRGVHLREVNLSNVTVTPEALLEQACDDSTRLLAISSVQFASGLTLDLNRLGSFCKAHKILFCIDAIQSIGALQLDVQSCNADFVIADGHKWMMAPEGLALFYCRAELREKLRLHEFGWHMCMNQSDYDNRNWQPAPTARRFECGSPNMLGVHAMSSSVGLLLEIGLPAIEKRICEIGRYLSTQLSNIDGIEILDNNFRSGSIVAFKFEQIPSNDLYNLLVENNIICAIRSGAIRFSPHFYTNNSQIDSAIKTVERIANNHT